VTVPPGVGLGLGTAGEGGAGPAARAASGAHAADGRRRQAETDACGADEIPARLRPSAGSQRGAASRGDASRPSG
jgi:hypothetical protein